MVKFGLLFCTDSISLGNNASSTETTDRENGTVSCDPVLDVCRSWNYTIEMLIGGIMNFTFVETASFETRKNGSIQFTGLLHGFMVSINQTELTVFSIDVHHQFTNMNNLSNYNVISNSNMTMNKENFCDNGLDYPN